MKRLISIFSLLVILMPISVFADNTYTADLESSSSQYFSITDASQTGLDLSSAFTIELWFKPESTGETIRLISKNGANGSYTFTYTNTGYLQIFLDESSDFSSFDILTASVASNFSTGTWYHLAVTWLGSSKEANFYVNGEKIGTTRTGSNVDTIINNNQAFQIGANDGGTNSFVDGMVDDVRIYSDVLSATEILDYYNCQLSASAGEPDNLISNWLFNNDANDATASNNDLTNNNSATFQSGSLPYTDDCAVEEEPEEPIATSTASFVDCDNMSYNQKCTITGYEYASGTLATTTAVTTYNYMNILVMVGELLLGFYIVLGLIKYKAS